MKVSMLVPAVLPRSALWITIALSGIAALGAEPRAAEAWVPELDVKYTNKPRGFVLRFPGGWDLEDLGSPTTDRWDLLVLNPVEHGNNAGIHLTVYRQPGKADELYGQLRAESDKTGEAESVTAGAVEISGRPWRFFTARYPKRSETRLLTVYVTSAQDSVFVLRCFMEDPEDVATAKLLDRMVREVSFL